MLDVTSAYGLTFLFPTGDLAVGRSLRDNGEFSRIEVDFFLDHASSSGGEFIDVGANIGAVALPFAAQRPDWRVTAIEAHRGLAGILAANALNNRLLNTQTYHAAVGAQPGLVDFPSPPLSEKRNYGELGFGVEAPMEAVRMLTLDAISSRETRLVKIDVEGFEPDVLAGAQGLIRSQRPIWLIEATVQHPKAAAHVISTLQEAGYGVFWFFVPFATHRAPKGPPATPAKGDANVVAIPPGQPNRWALRPVGAPDEKRPGDASAYPYLSRYGY